MKLSKQQISTIRKQTGMAPVPDQAARPDLVQTFGDQTFYLDQDGLYVFESSIPPSGEGDCLIGIQLADVKRDPGEDEVELRPVTPRISGFSAEMR